MSSTNAKPLIAYRLQKKYGNADWSWGMRGRLQMQCVVDTIRKRTQPLRRLMLWRYWGELVHKTSLHWLRRELGYPVPSKSNGFSTKKYSWCSLLNWTRVYVLWILKQRWQYQYVHTYSRCHIKSGSSDWKLVLNAEEVKNKCISSCWNGNPAPFPRFWACKQWK